MNQQREVIYGQRRKILEGQELRELVKEMTEDLLDEIVGLFVNDKIPAEEWDLKSLRPTNSFNSFPAGFL